MRGSLFFAVVVFASFSTPASAGPVDTIAIVEPLDETYFPEAPIDLTVVVESANKSGLVFELVGLEVDGIPVPADQTCDGPGTCMFLVPLEEGDHELRAYAERNIGPPLES